jgi:hypothetical protein
MKIEKTAEGKDAIRLSQKEWIRIGQIQNWSMPQAEVLPDVEGETSLTPQAAEKEASIDFSDLKLGWSLEKLADEVDPQPASQQMICKNITMGRHCNYFGPIEDFEGRGVLHCPNCGQGPDGIHQKT